MACDLELLKNKCRFIYPDNVTALLGKEMPNMNILDLQFKFFRFDSDVNYSLYKPEYDQPKENPYWACLAFRTIYSNN